jgi:outer membrane protein assembly factor BamD (BamD/ComL family)
MFNSNCLFWCDCFGSKLKKVNKMSKWNVDEILNDTLPEPSKETYNKKWVEFNNFIGEKPKPEEADYIQYFDNLHTEKKLKALTIWCTYSMLNAVHQRELGEKLQAYPRVTQLLKSYNSTYERKVVSVFNKNYFTLCKGSFNYYVTVKVPLFGYLPTMCNGA